MDLKNIIIFLVVFFIVLWLQHNDDRKFNKSVALQRPLYDKIKLPLIVSSLVILIKLIDYDELYNNFNFMIKGKTPLDLSETSINTASLPVLNNQKVLNDIFTGPPDF